MSSEPQQLQVSSASACKGELLVNFLRMLSIVCRRSESPLSPRAGLVSLVNGVPLVSLLWNPASVGLLVFPVSPFPPYPLTSDSLFPSLPYVRVTQAFSLF